MPVHQLGYSESQGAMDESGEILKKKFKFIISLNVHSIFGIFPSRSVKRMPWLSVSHFVLKVCVTPCPANKDVARCFHTTRFAYAAHISSLSPWHSNTQTKQRSLEGLQPDCSPFVWWLRLYCWIIWDHFGSHLTCYPDIRTLCFVKNGTGNDAAWIFITLDD